MSEKAKGPLAGVKVLDVTMNLAGPAAAMHLADFGAEDHLVKFRHHLALTKLAEVSAALSRGTIRMRFGQIFETGAIRDLSLEIFAGFLRLDENMLGACRRHYAGPFRSRCFLELRSRRTEGPSYSSVSLDHFTVSYTHLRAHETLRYLV